MQIVTTRKTNQKSAIEQVFRQQDRPLGIEEILKHGRKTVKSLNQATVYRNVKCLIGKGWLRRINHPLLGPIYERTDKEHHHNFHCHACNRVFELPGCYLSKKLSVPDGFVVEGHEIFIFGVCPSCAH